MTTRPLPLSIQAVRVFTAGDPGAGIPGWSATVRTDGDSLIDMDGLSPEDRAAEVEQFRAGLATTFGWLWTGCPTVVFDFEQTDQQDG